MTTKKVLTPKDVAVYALRELGVGLPYILDFDANDNVYLFDNGDIRRVDPNSILGRKIQSIEKRSKVKVYAVVYSIIDLVGPNYSFLCVSPYAEDWQHMFHRSGNLFTAYSYVWNTLCEECSEFGSVVLTSTHGMLRRLG